MKTLVVKLPGSLRRELPKSAKLRWMLPQLHEVSGSTPASQRRLGARYQLARNTILSGMSMNETRHFPP